MPNMVLVSEQPPKQEEVKKQTSVVTVSSVIGTAALWSAITGFFVLIGTGGDWWTVLSPLFFAVVLLAMVPVHKMED